MMQCVRNYGVVGMVLWPGLFVQKRSVRRFSGTNRVCRVSRLSKVKVRVGNGIRVSVRITVSLVLMIGWG